jgi:hypothetical protein
MGEYNNVVWNRVEYSVICVGNRVEYSVICVGNRVEYSVICVVCVVYF